MGHEAVQIARTRANVEEAKSIGIGRQVEGGEDGGVDVRGGDVEERVFVRTVFIRLEKMVRIRLMRNE